MKDTLIVFETSRLLATEAHKFKPKENGHITKFNGRLPSEFMTQDERITLRVARVAFLRGYSPDEIITVGEMPYGVKKLIEIMRATK